MYFMTGLLRVSIMMKPAFNEQKDNEEEVIHELEHYQQLSNWDCGIACVLMVLPTPSRNYFIKNFSQVVEEEKFGESTWTIDLAYLLDRFHMKFKYFTTTIGIDPGYSKENFYDKVLSKDTERVNEKFSLAKQRGIHVEKNSVSINEIIENLQKGPVIVLTNAHQLHCTACSNSIASTYTALSSCLRICPPAYQGHYITLVGYNKDKNEVYYRNPTNKDKVCRMPYSRLDECRTAYGTDEDIIFVQKSAAR
eukprot:TRINITY_DN10350_c2_g1_i1.p1 TRINITY_DN10350_c2_g1~~TRINITY_DN10350_c2_g1_i1.p1  ORF type:complete len:251 (-),score=11.10 TRINITY_DN10350_c2_g1_i1:209-961(-)